MHSRRGTPHKSYGPQIHGGAVKNVVNNKRLYM